MSLLLDGVEEGVAERLLGGDALVRVELQHRQQQLHRLRPARREPRLEVLETMLEAGEKRIC